MNWHTKEIRDILDDLGSSPGGLSSEGSKRRLAELGYNELREEKKKGPFKIFLNQFNNFIILVLVAAAVISGVIGDFWDTVAITAIIILNAFIGFLQEYRAEKAIVMLKKMAALTATVLRDGGPATIPARELVPGDIVLLESGRVVPADIRIVEASHMRVVEAALTGESGAVEKTPRTLHDEILPLADRRNMAYAGTVVSYGRGRGVVVSTGMKTEIGAISAMLQEGKESETPLQKRLERFGRRLVIAILVICFIIFVAGIFRGEPLLLMFLTSVSLAVAAVPEALPAVVTISLALGARKMVKQNALIRKLSAVETLGSVTYICSDKTGTLTTNMMRVERIFANGRILERSRIQGFKDSRGKNKFPLEPLDPESLLMVAFALSNDAQADASGNVVGDPTEAALFLIARESGFDKSAIEKEFPRTGEIPFDPERKCMTTIHRRPDGGFISFTKGAIDILVDRSANILTSDGLKSVDREGILKVNEEMTADGLRVLGVAMRKWEDVSDDASPEHVETGLSILGLAGMMDPPRNEASEAVRLCKAAGIRAVMITGDHPLTAKAIAQRIGIVEDDEKSMISGEELERLSIREFEGRVEQTRVYARVAPEQKLKIVRALQDKGQFVAMTGDGVNDAPSLKRANIGIAMGITGTDVAKEAAHMVLLDDNFATIVHAVREGRRIYDNIRKFIKYLLTTNSGEIWTLFFAPFAGLPIPLLPVHILWINLMTDGLPALALSVEPEEGDVMKRPPRAPDESIFAHGLGIHVLWVGLLMACIVLFVQAWSIRSAHTSWQTMVFTVLCLTQLGHVLAVRSERRSFFRMGLMSNPYLLGAVSLTFVLQMMVIYVPFFNRILKTSPLSPSELAFTIMLSSLVFFAVEAEKFVRRMTHS